MFQHFFLILPMLFGIIGCETITRECPACVDFNSHLFVYKDHDKFFDGNYRNYVIAYSAKECLEHDYINVTCTSSCLRMHITKTLNHKTKTIGWVFGCSNTILRAIPPTVTGNRPETKTPQEDYHFVDNLNNYGRTRYEIEVNLYRRESDVETVRTYYKQLNAKEQYELEYKYQCRTSFFNCYFYKTSKTERLFYTIGFLVVACVLFCLSCCLCVKIIKCFMCIPNKKRDPILITNVGYKKTDDNDEGGEVIIRSEKNEKDEDPYAEA